jgi:hypothetical protein
MRPSLPLLLLALGPLSSIACKSEEDRACLAQFASAQAVVMDVDAEKLESVDGAVAALDSAIAACKQAERGGEVDELVAAHAKLAAHRDRVVRRDELRRARSEIPPEQLAELVKSGDAKCPRGQAYLHKKSGQRIRCTGPHPIEMDEARATEYFKGRGYKVAASTAPRELRFEYGAELVVFQFEEAPAPAPPRCVLLYPAPEMSWQEATARLTGVAPARLAPGRPITGGAKPRPLAVEDTKEKVLARIGDCDGAVQEPR